MTFFPFVCCHVCFNVGLGYNCGCLDKHVVRLTCPDQFLSPNGKVPDGCVSVTVTAHCDSTKIEHHTIHAEHLTASPPRGKDQNCLILKGDRAGQVHKVKDCKSRQQKVILYDRTLFTFDDICLVIDAA